MTPQLTRRTLLAQHEQLRGRFVDCSALARRLRDGEPVLMGLDVALTHLRDAFSEHNVLESLLVCRVLHDSLDRSKLLIDRMFEEHVAEHVVFRGLLAPTSHVAVRMDDLLEELEAHMAAEERTFLSSQVLSDNALGRRSLA